MRKVYRIGWLVCHLLFVAMMAACKHDQAEDGESGTGGNQCFDHFPARVDEHFGVDGMVFLYQESTAASQNIGWRVFLHNNALRVAGTANDVLAGERVAAFQVFDNGTLDLAYGGSGTGYFATRLDRTRLKPTDAASYRDGRMLLVGNDGYQTVLVRLRVDGTLDDTFGAEGYVLSNWATRTVHTQRVTLTMDERIVVVAENAGNVMVERFLADGSLDPTFADQGRTILSLPGPFHFDRIRIDELGNLYIPGYYSVRTEESWAAIIRLLPDGRRDYSFGEVIDEEQLVGVARFRQRDRSRLYALALTPRGDMIAVGDACVGVGTNCDDLLLKFDSTGRLDLQFGTDGVVRTDIGPLTFNSAHEIALDAQQRIITAGEVILPVSLPGIADCKPKKVTHLMRYLADGTPDSSFGRHGRRFAGDIPGEPLQYPQDMVIDDAGNIVVIGVAYTALPDSSSEQAFPYLKRFLP